MKQSSKVWREQSFSHHKTLYTVDSFFPSHQQSSVSRRETQCNSSHCQNALLLPTLLTSPQICYQVDHWGLAVQFKCFCHCTFTLVLKIYSRHENEMQYSPLPPALMDTRCGHEFKGNLGKVTIKKSIEPY